MLPEPSTLLSRAISVIYSRSSSKGLLTEADSGLGGATDALPTSTESNHLPDPDLASAVSSDPSSDNDIAVASPLGIELPESVPTPSACTLSTSTAHGASITVSLDGLSSADGVRSRSERRLSACSPTEPPTTCSLAKLSTFHLTADTTMPPMVGWEQYVVGGVGCELPTIEEGATTLDQAIVWPSSAQVPKATGVADEVEVYGGGQIIGINGDVILSADSLGEKSRYTVLTRFI